MEGGELTQFFSGFNSNLLLNTFKLQNYFFNGYFPLSATKFPIFRGLYAAKYLPIFITDQQYFSFFSLSYIIP